MARSTAARERALTFGEPLITRETVPRPTPARAATAFSVGRRVPAVLGWDSAGLIVHLPAFGAGGFILARKIPRAAGLPAPLPAPGRDHLCDLRKS
ncbi:hypothetical protein GCM10010512_46260 [Streptomyces thermoviolaceus subsp. thermoviolaceus]|nr:hypothetical protein GCM10010499_27220 [Streptomyces thermoviolaceus subsp. apingens]GHB09506.1 hypothetical protein GCM10010512_46260 [Streptomyces thermoviolaceus subsp. thermoviolaceus]